VAEQTRVDWEKLLEEALTAPGNLTGVYDRFWNYSLTNMFLFMMQGIHEPVASFSRWKSLGRHVLQGARAKEVIVPLLVNEELPDPDDPDKRERVQRLLGFKVVRAVFTLSDTEGKEPLPLHIRGWDVQTALDKLGIRQVPFDQINGNVQGVSSGVEIQVNPLAVHPEKTLMHELGHVVLGHTLPHSLEDYQAHRGIKEFQAEATAYLTMNELEQLDDETAAHSRGYIQHYLEGERPPDTAIRQVFTAAERILRAGRIADGDTIPSA
jgi:hypothetical protein